MDLSPLDRLTRKRNMLLQKQLDVQLQIIHEEYRMTRKDLDKGSKNLAEFLFCLKHTAPGLHTYGQPDTRAMNAKSILLERRYEQENADLGAGAQDGKTAPAVHPSLKDTAKRRPQSSKENPLRKPAGTGREKDDESGGEKEADTERQRAASASAYRNEFFNRRIVLDSKRRSFLQHALEKNAGGTKGASNSDTSKPLARAATHSGFYSNRDTKGEISTTRPKSSTAPRTHRPTTPKYGREAESQVNEDSRKNVLEMFDVIFDPTSERPGRSRPASTPATPLYVPKEEAEPPQVPPININASHVPNSGGGGGQPLQKGYLLNRRVAWSAPPKRREDPSIRAVVDSNNENHPSRESQSVTPRSGTAHLTTANKPPARSRPNSHVPRTTSHDLHTSSHSDARGLRSPRLSSEHPTQSHHVRQATPQHHGQRNGQAGDMNNKNGDPRVFTRRVVTQQELDMRAQRQRALGHMLNSVGTTVKRPRTAPQPNYELMRRSVAAPRQQVAGILAEIQSRRADTRAMLSKSRQLKQMVQTLVSDDTTLDDSLSD